MNFAYCILLCLAATTIIVCYGEDQFCTDMKSFLDKSYNANAALNQCRSNFLQSRERVIALRSQMQVTSNILFYPPLVYNNKKYFISKSGLKDLSNANSYCSALGGYLAEIDDINEYKAVQGFALNSSSNHVYIAGDDTATEGVWIFPRTGLPVKFFDWNKGQPDNYNNAEDCMSIAKMFQGQMNDMPCVNSVDAFMCEVPNNF